MSASSKSTRYFRRAAQRAASYEEYMSKKDPLQSFDPMETEDVAAKVPFREALKARLSIRTQFTSHEMPPELQDFAGNPPEDIHFRCGRCFRNGKLRKADLFSYTPMPSSNRRLTPEPYVLEGRCLECAQYFKGTLLEYDLGRRLLWARFCREISSRVMDS